VKVGRGPRPFIGAGGRWRRQGLNGRRQCRALKTPVTQSEEGEGFMAELERVTELRRGRPLGLSMVRRPWCGGAQGVALSRLS
jgi:hypothetical protein